jgi:hypothetical protein
MSLILIYIAIAFTVVSLVLMMLPLFGTRRERVRVEYIEDELRTIEALAAKRAALLQQLRDLEFDRETDKVSEDDYKRFKRRYELEAVAVMRQLDGLRGGQNWDKLVDAEIRAHLEVSAPDLIDTVASATYSESDSSSDDANPVASEQAEEPAQDVAAVESDADPVDAEDEPDDDAEEADGELICGSCGADLAPDDRFCRKCGAATPTSQDDAAEASA